MIAKAAWWVSGVVGSALALPIIGRFVEGYGERAGWFDDPKASVDQWWSTAISWLGWLAKQAWYTHSAVAMLAFMVGAYSTFLWLAAQTGRSMQDQTKPDMPTFLQLQTSIDRTMSALDEVLEWAEMGVANISDYERSSAEWKSMSIVFERFGMPLWDGKGTAQAVAKGRRAFLERLYPLVRDGHIEEARREAAAPDIFS